jgi:acetyl esterase/lipase
MARRSTVAVPVTPTRGLGLDIFHPETNAHGVAVVLLHGGGWRFGSRDDVAGFAEALAGHGFTAIAAEYRLLGEAAWPAQIDDVTAVIAWVAENAATLQVRADAIVLEGFSAGGHLALLAAARAPQVAAVVAFFAPPSLHKPADAPGPDPAAMLLGPNAGAASVTAASPIAHITPSYPPSFLLSGTADFIVPPHATLALFEAMLAHGVPAELHLYSGHTHEFARLPSMLAPVQAEVALFLVRHVVDPARYAQENLELNIFAQPGGPPMPDQPAAALERV